MDTSYEIRLSREFVKELKKLKKGGDGYIIDKVRTVIDELSTDPFTRRSKVDIKLISPIVESIYRVRIGEYRLIYEVDKVNKIVWITGIFHRKKAYMK